MICRLLRLLLQRTNKDGTQLRTFISIRTHIDDTALLLRLRQHSPRRTT